MSEPALRVEQLGKHYQIGGPAPTYATLRDALMMAITAPWRRFRRLSGDNASQPAIWALRGVSLEVQPGEVVGIIGRNGAGKSTLLKILSQITEPTEGRVTLNGRVASLLEVGTGFHPELTGRENVFLNGAILGMGRKEIAAKFDEIVAFAEVDKFIDTPVKFYSTGMYMRLAFAVAAHLEPDILVVDEVLAVGDNAFQQKCLGKMDEVSRTGRTVLFVSHNMQAVSQLTNRCVVLANGAVVFDGPTRDAISKYINTGQHTASGCGYYRPKGYIAQNHVGSARVITSEAGACHSWGDPISFEFELHIVEPSNSLCFSFQIINDKQQPVCHFWLFDPDVPYRLRAGRFLLRLHVPKLRLYQGEYSLVTWLSDRRADTIQENLHGICSFHVTMLHVPRLEYEWAPEDCVYLEDGNWLPVISASEAKPLPLLDASPLASADRSPLDVGV